MVISPNINTINLIYLSGLILFQIKYKPISNKNNTIKKSVDLIFILIFKHIFIYN